MFMNNIIGIGEVLWDMFPEGKVLGGAPANFAYHVSQFGFSGCAISAIGKDALGEEIVESLKTKKLKNSMSLTSFPTGTVRVTLTGNGVPSYEICEDVAWDNIPFTPELEALAKTAKAVCFGSLAQRSKVSYETITRFLDMVPADSYKIFDINLRQKFFTKELIHSSFKRCNVLKINDEEVVVVANLFGWNNLDEMAVCKRIFDEYDLKILVLTRGTNGSYVITRDEVSFLDTPKVKVVDTVGAGDSFTGAFVAGLLKGFAISKAHRLAVDVSAFVCTQQGAMPQLPAAILDATNV